MLGEQYFPPVQSVRWKYWELRRDTSRKSTTEEPLKA
jgi:hypothetical protein